MTSAKKSFAGLGEDLLGDVNTIQELTLILSADSARLGDLGAHEGDHGVVVSFEDEFILDFDTELDGDTSVHNDLVNLASTQEVLQLNGLAVFGNVGIDREVSVYESHLVDVALRWIIIIKLEQRQNTRDTRWGVGSDAVVE